LKVVVNMNIKNVIENFDHNSNNFPNGIGVNTDATLAETIYDWLHEGESHSHIIERILTHETLTDNEKVFALITAGQFMALGGLYEMAMEQEA